MPQESHEERESQVFDAKARDVAAHRELDLADRVGRALGQEAPELLGQEREGRDLVQRIGRQGWRVDRVDRHPVEQEVRHLLGDVHRHA